MSVNKMKCFRRVSLALPVIFICALITSAQTPAQPPAGGQAAAPPNIEGWEDDFNAAKLDEEKWERYSFEGGSGGKVEVSDGQLRQRGADGSRAGVRTKKTFESERFLVSADVAKAGVRYPAPGSSGPPPGNAIVTVLFGGSSENRLEWLITSDGRLEAWQMRDRKSERLNTSSLGTREKTPRLGIARRGDQIFFMLNGEVGLQKTVKALPNSFRVMLYGFGSSENNWDAVVVQTLKQ
jgi:hypothetical protein